MEPTEENLLKLKQLINSLDGFKFDDIKRIYPNSDIITIDKLKDYILNRNEEQKDYLQILLVLNSEQEPHGHFICADSYGHIFDPLGNKGLINMNNITPEVRDYLLKFSNMERIQSVDSECCGLLCLLYIFLNLITTKKNKCFVNVKNFKKIIDNLQSDYPDGNIFNLIYELTLKIKNY